MCYYELQTDWCYVIAGDNYKWYYIRCEHEFGTCGGPMLSIIFPHGEPGFTNEMKDHISPADYVMARMLMPEKIERKYMTAPARYY
jgi:hypothetical protein